ncbi:putative disease resistance protein RGA4 [Camellia sinensis]|uniref:putative disease resistance protein RGA4 n=1 Tax=Camellia sinensis TaxID=4442 RepID=UPI0010359F3E|nr:putative disease resistance protein RGA4 [Camellia sinensis]
MAFNDERVKHHFNLKIWVYVSQDFDVKRVIKATTESANGNACEAVDLDSLQRRLRNMLNGKRYLIILDDLWDEDPVKWDALKYSLARASKSASIIVTTRVDKVALIIRTISPHRLSFLSKEDCWLLFRQRAFGCGNEEHPNLVAIGKEIVKKCGGEPLAAKALRGLMCFKSEEKEWLHVKESEELKADICFQMHDLAHELAQSIMKDECEMIKFNSSSNISNEKVRHVTLVVRPGENFNNTFHKVVSLRTLLLQSTFSLEDDELLCDFRKFGSLRAFDAGARRMKELPSSIGNLKHLSLLAELKCLNLGGELRIEHLVRVSNPMDAKEANLVGKQNLCLLELNGGHELIEFAFATKPSNSGNGGSSVENEYPCGGEFPSLEELYVDNCPKLEGLSREDGKELFPRLRKIEISDCLKLSFPHLSSPKELLLEGKCTMVLNSISNHNSLTSLAIDRDKETVCFPKEFLRNLTVLELQHTVW